MARKKLVTTIDDIDVDTLPFQSRTTTFQYVLKALEDRCNRAKKHDGFPCQITLRVKEIAMSDALIV